MKTYGTYDNQTLSIWGGMGANSILYIDPNLQETVKDNFDLTFGNGIKFYSKINYTFSKKLKGEIAFIHFPPIKFFKYKDSVSLIGVIPVERMSSENYNNLSLGFKYEYKKIKIFLYAKNLLNSTPPLMFSISCWEKALKRAENRGLFAGIFYKF